MEYKRGSLQRHEELKSQILAHPELLGINKEDIIEIETEYPLKKKKRAIAKPDIVITYRHNKYIRKKYIEVKSGNCRRAIEGLNMQLRKINKFLRNKKMEGEVIGVYPAANTLEFLVL